MFHLVTLLSFILKSLGTPDIYPQITEISPNHRADGDALLILAASSLTPANKGTSNNRRFERHLYAMSTDHVNTEMTSIAQQKQRFPASEQLVQRPP